MSTWWNSQQGEGEYTLQFGTDNRAKYRLVEKAAQMAIDGKTVDDVVEVKHGEWLKLDGEWREHGTNRQLIIHQCSCCGMYFQNAPYQYCPHCGAKMDGGRKNDGKG